MAEARAKDFDIPQGKELKFESSNERETRVVVKVVEGEPEVFGTRLEQGKVYMFPLGAKGAVSAPSGPCKVQLMNQEKTVTVPYSGEMYLPFLKQMNAKRAEAKKNNAPGPNILVCGPVDTGKSTLCKYLINSAVRDSAHCVTFVDCDLGQNSITVPGSIASVFVDSEIDVQEGFSLLPPLAFFFGELTLKDSTLGKYHHLCCQTAACIKANAENRTEFLSGGTIVNTMGWVKDVGLQSLKLIIEAMSINVIVVLEDKHLHDMLNDPSMRDKGLQTYFFEKQHVVQTRSQQFRKIQRGERVSEYFRGANTVLHPSKVIVSFNDVKLFQVGGEAPSALAAASQSNSIPDYLHVHPVTPDTSHTLCIAAVSHASCPEEVAHANVAGYVIILNVDFENNSLTLLMPSGSQPPRRFLIISRIAVCYEDVIG